MYYFLKIITFLFVCIIAPCIVKGKKNIPKGKCVFCVNHKSNFDCVYLLSYIWRKQHILAKKELFEKKALRPILKAMGTIPVNREKVELGTIKQCFSILNKGKILTIFPEGTRNKTKEALLPFKAGAIEIALKSKAPIVPIVIKKRGKIFCINKMIIGKPIYLNNIDLGENKLEKATEIVRDEMLKLLK